MLHPRGQLLRAALGFATLSMPSYDRASWALRTWLDSWTHVAVGMARQGFDLQLTRSRRARLASYLLHDGDGALAYERDGYSVGAHAVACDAASGVGGVETL